MIVALLLGCTYRVDLDDTGVLTSGLPDVKVSSLEEDFGTVMIGTKPVSRRVTVSNAGTADTSVRLGLALADPRLCVYWDADSRTCPAGTVQRRAGAAVDAADSGGGGSRETGDTGGSGGGNHRCAGGGEDAIDATALPFPVGCSEDAVVVLDPFRAGRVFTGLSVESLADDASGALEDPRNRYQHVRIDGEVEDAYPEALAWSPVGVAFPWQWPDAAGQEIVATLVNSDVVDAELGTVDVSRCPDFTVVDGPARGEVLAAGASRSVTFRYVARSPSPGVCVATIRLVRGGTDHTLILRQEPEPAAAAPSVSLRSPAAAAALSSADPLVVTVDLSAPLAPPSALAVRVEANGSPVGEGVPADDSGTATFTFAAPALASGPAALVVTVTDDRGQSTRASVPVSVDVLPAGDADGDAFGTTDGDCDDTDPGAYPGAVEVANGRDDDCDGAVDDETELSDDDGDGVAEVDGDCDDADSGRHPGATERADGADDDCDGLVDEGTDLADDDGDGFDETQGDCDDADATVHPEAAEACDGLDHDCDGLRDAPAACTEVVGYLEVTPDACEAGETVEATFVTPDLDLDVEWSLAGAPIATYASGPSLTLDCPIDRERVVAEVFSLANSPSGHQVWNGSPLVVYPAGEAPWDLLTRGEPIGVTTPCNPSGAAAFFGMLAVLGTAANLRRR